MTQFEPPPQPPSEADASKNWAAITALVIGCVNALSWCVPLGVGGIVFGVIGLKSQKRGMAMAGLIICIVLSIINGIWGAYLMKTGQHPLFPAPSP